MAPATSHHQYPPFADGVTTAPLVSISLASLEADDASESAAFFKASRELGFFYMDMNGSALRRADRFWRRNSFISFSKSSPSFQTRRRIGLQEKSSIHSSDIDSWGRWRGQVV